MAKLNRSRQEAFASLVASGMAPDLAVTAAGYRAENTQARAEELLARAEIAARIAALRLEVGKASAVRGPDTDTCAPEAEAGVAPPGRTIDRDWVVDCLVENVERSLGLKPMRDRTGRPVGGTGHQGSVANKALELLGRQLGLFKDKDKDKDEGKGGGLDELSDAELERLDRDLGRQIAALEGIRRRAETRTAASPEPERAD